MKKRLQQHLVGTRYLHGRMRKQDCRNNRKRSFLMQQAAHGYGYQCRVPPYEYYEGENVVWYRCRYRRAVADKLGMELKIEDMDLILSSGGNIR